MHCEEPDAQVRLAVSNVGYYDTLCDGKRLQAAAVRRGQEIKGEILHT